MAPGQEALLVDTLATKEHQEDILLKHGMDLRWGLKEDLLTAHLEDPQDLHSHTAPRGLSTQEVPLPLVRESLDILPATMVPGLTTALVQEVWALPPPPPLAITPQEALQPQEEAPVLQEVVPLDTPPVPPLQDPLTRRAQVLAPPHSWRPRGQTGSPCTTRTPSSRPSLNPLTIQGAGRHLRGDTLR